MQSKNDVCLFRHPVTRVKALVWVDDVFMRGVRQHTSEVWAALDAKFGLKLVEYLGVGEERTFLKISMMQSKVGDSVVYVMHQNGDMSSSLSEHKVEGAPLKSPMRDRKDLFVNSTPASAAQSKWFRSVLMSLSYFACWTRLDIACPVNRLAQMLSNVTVSAVDELKRIIRYLNGRPSFTLMATRPKNHATDVWSLYVDSDLAGEAPQDTKSRTGSFFSLNGMECLSSGAARSNLRQCSLVRRLRSLPSRKQLRM